MIITFVISDDNSNPKLRVREYCSNLPSTKIWRYRKVFRKFLVTICGWWHWKKGEHPKVQNHFCSVVPMLNIDRMRYAWKENVCYQFILNSLFYYFVVEKCSIKGFLQRTDYGSLLWTMAWLSFCAFVISACKGVSD